MKVSVNKPEFSDLFIFGLKRASAKACTTSIKRDEDNIYIEAKSGDRVVGKFSFVIEGDECKMIKKFVIEKDYYPLELTIANLAKFLKRKKVKFVIWE